MIQETTYQIIAAAILASGALISIWHRHKAQKSGQAAGDRISAVREEKPLLLGLRSIFGLGLWLGSLAYLLSPGWMAWAQVDLPDVLRLAGAAGGAVSVLLIYWVFSSLGRNVTPTTAVRSQHTLVTSGPYRWVRHPLYSVGTFFFLAFSLLTANAFILLCAVVGFTAIALRTPLEEQRLLEHFGEEYRQYMQQTGRYLPKVM
jgi:protein-S-isoprenylcysteine O-methyltransferase Ste14